VKNILSRILASSSSKASFYGHPDEAKRELD